ncbi:MAG: hypothetical protein JNM84_05555 [Planctomycetes bacterium]|nr:hypothetical protein [Planctomycetota bacterium]
MGNSNAGRALIAVACCGALGAALWLLLSSRADRPSAASLELATSRESEHHDHGLWTPRGESRASSAGSDDAGIAHRRESAPTPTEESAAPDVPPYGVRVRVLDERGTPRGGWPVVLLREDPKWRELASSPEICEPGKKVKNCGLCHSEPRGELQPTPSNAWSPRALEGLYEADPYIARGITAEGSGEHFFPIAPDGARYAVRLECTTEPFRSVPVEPASPPSLVDLNASGIELVHVRVADDETWHLRPTMFAPWQSDGHAWAWASGETLVLGPGKELAYPVETTAVLRFEAWLERPFAPRLHLEAERSARGRELVLDRRRHYVSASVRLADANGEPLGSRAFLAELYERAPAREAQLTTDAGGVARFLLDRTAPPHRERGISFSPWPQPPRSIELPHRGNRDLTHPDRDQAHVDLATAFDASGDFDLGVARLGTGPLLWKGRVVDSAGRGLPDAAAILCARGETVPCAPDGSFERRGFSDGKAQMISAAALGYTTLDLEELVPPQLELRLELHAEASLEARIDAPPELLRHPVVLFVERADKEAEQLNLLTEAKAESFDEQGFVRIEGLPATALRIAFKVENVRVHEFPFEARPGKNELPHLDLGALLKPLRYELAERVSEDALVRVRGIGASGVIFEELCMIRAHLGTLQLWVPRACERWNASYLGKKAEGSTADAQPIVLR